jgi:hypothetical protein
VEVKRGAKPRRRRWRMVLDVYIECRSAGWVVGVRRGIYVLG